MLSKGEGVPPALVLAGGDGRGCPCPGSGGGRSHGSHLHWKPGKMSKVFPVREESGNFKIMPESRGKVREFWVSQGKLDKTLIL